MVGIYNKECYSCFLKEATKYLTKNEDNLEKVKESFLCNISEDKDSLAKFIDKIDTIKKELKEDLDFYMISDPAIDSSEEVVLAYPGYKAITCYRIAHALRETGLKVQARLISELAHSATGIDIHPAAKIGTPFFIDHGTGIVIGETTVIGSRVKLYQGVTLGALSLENATSLRGVKRHPTIEDNVTIYACASILGDIVISTNCTIGANVFLTESVAPNQKVTIGKPTLVYK
ncbi:MAG: serine acetyltransferase, partial [Bacilli bacterium]|nr:serine acetyltransferase [Bacilli bacterium]